MSMYLPTVVEKDGRGERSQDILSRLLRDRIVYLNGEVNDEVSCSIVSQMLFLEKEDSTKDVSLYISSPGGSVTAGLAIFDIMNLMKYDVKTLCIGHAYSMGAFLLAAGAKGKRFSLPNSRIMIHQPLGGAQGQATDIQIQAKEIEYLKENLSNILHSRTEDNISKEMLLTKMERDCYLGPKEALEIGLIDKIL